MYCQTAKSLPCGLICSSSSLLIMIVLSFWGYQKILVLCKTQLLHGCLSRVLGQVTRRAVSFT